MNGNVRAKEIKVDAEEWPDYVFFPGYPKLSLRDTQKFILENGHLPEVPSAKEVAENGQSLGEMNKLLLKKIEELTLYLIDKENILEAERLINKKQDERIEFLERKFCQNQNDFV